jgi:hypothetical protein
MSQPRPAPPAKLVIGFFTADRSILAPAVEALTGRFGPVDTVGPWLPFDQTDYYAAEMGTPLHRRMTAFSTLIPQETLPAVKHAANEVESAFRRDGRRRINIDPGYLVHERFVLATGKNFSHRIYLGDGIYADLTLIYTRGAYQPLPWTYPDYADGRMRRFLGLIREKYTHDLKEAPTAP